MKIIKILFITTLLLSFGRAAVAQSQINAIDKYFQQYVDDENFTVVYISPKMFEMFSKLDAKVLEMEDHEATAIMEMAREMRGLRILTTDVNPGKYYKEAKAKVNTSEYEVLMTVRDKDGSNVEFLVIENGDAISELLLMVGGEDEFLLLSFVGNITMEAISKLAKSFDEDEDDEDDHDKNK